MTDETKRLSRRRFVAASVVSLTSILSFLPVKAEEETRQERDPWLDKLTNRKSLGAPLSLLRFADAVYVLTKPIAWAPNPGQPHKGVEVPAGFVTDFGSLPRVFWSLLRPSDEYAYAAVIHDYLYWTQDRSREESDQVFRLVMEDLSISPTMILTVYQAVRSFGDGAWDSNAKLKANGEKRVLKMFPTDPSTTWDAFKKHPEVFAE